jgi:D-3-phosphoglycerate dehydrogenase
MSRKKVVIDVPSIHEDGLKVFERAEDIDVVRFNGDQSLEETLKDAHAVLAGLSIFDKKVIESAVQLELIVRHGVGYDNVDVAAATAKKIAVITTPWANSSSVAEFTVSCMLALAKKLFPSNVALKTGKYGVMKQFTGIDLWGRTVGVIGIGRIGSEVVRLCRSGFHMKAIAYDPFVTNAYANTVGAQRVEDLEELLRPSDFVTIHAPLTPLTKSMIDEKGLKLMKETAYLINTARGGIVNEEALLMALNEGWIAGAALDVLEEEPPSPDHPLLNHDKVLVTPHTAANTYEAMSRMATMAAEEILRVLSGERPMNILNPEIYL